MWKWRRVSRRVDLPVRETQYLISTSEDAPFFVSVEPEGMSWDFTSQDKVLLSFRGRTAIQYIDLVHHKDGIEIWRPGDTEVWATLSNGMPEQIAGFSDIRAPWIDSGSGADGPPPWNWPPAPPA